MIKVATDEDFETVAKYTECLTKESIYSKLFKDYKLTPEMFNYLTKNPGQCLCLLGYLESDPTTPVGFVTFEITVWPNIDHEVKLARLTYVYIEPDCRVHGVMDEFLEAFEYWGKKVGANYYCIGKTQDGIKRDGYQKVETIYMKEVQ